MNNKCRILICLLSGMLTLGYAAEMLIEAESFDDAGGWVVDQQYIEEMGSSYLLAHGLGEPVSNAVTSVEFPSVGEYSMWVRTKDWIPGDWTPPGRFQVLIDGDAVATEFGTVAGWTWQSGGVIDVTNTTVEISLQDLTGYNGRCDALYFNTEGSALPPDFDAADRTAHRQWRNELRGLSSTPTDVGEFDVVIVGGGIAGCAAALAADREGLSVALIQDRPLLGGNASSEIRVHTLGIHGDGGEILNQIDTIHWPNGSADSIADQDKREANMAAATNVTIFSSHRAYDVQMNGSSIESVDAVAVLTGESFRFHSDVFIDCTGDGWIGYWAGADYRYGRESKYAHDEGWESKGELWSPEVSDDRVMGTSLLWNSYNDETESVFQAVPWAMDVALNSSATAGSWKWEYSDNDKHQIHDAEEIRDHMLRAIYGSFYNAKQNPANANRKLKWVGYVNGKRESRRLMGDYVYKMSDAVSGTLFDDSVVQETRSIDVHYQQILHGSSTKNFLSEAYFKGVPRYYIPFRTLYSRNIDNLMMAGRNFSCTHIGLGGPRVMNTCGQMGIAVGYAASLCKEYDTTPRGVYMGHMGELKDLISGTPTVPSTPVIEIMNDGFEAAENLTDNGWSGGWTLSHTGWGNPSNYVYSTGDLGTISKDTGYAIQTDDELTLTIDLRDMNSAEVTNPVTATLYYNAGEGDVALGSADYIDADYASGTWRAASPFTVSATAESVGQNLQVHFDFAYAGGSGAQRFGIDNVLITKPDPDPGHEPDPDYDGDGIPDHLDFDDDNDGMPDAWELLHSLNPSADDRFADPDGDKRTNWEEYLADTNPAESNSVHTVALVPNIGSGDVAVHFGTSSSRIYSVYTSDDLSDRWTKWIPLFPGDGSETNIIDSLNQSNRFYRIESELR